MRQIITLLFLLFIAIPLYAQPPEQANNVQSPILVVDMKRVLDESRAAINVQKKIEERRSAFQKEIADKESAIRKAEQELLQARNTIDPKIYATKESDLRKKFREVEIYVQERRRVLEQASTTSLGKVRSVLQDIIKNIAQSRGSQAVLAKQQVLWTEGTLDITDTVLDRLNTELPDAQVVIEETKDNKKSEKAH